MAGMYLARRLGARLGPMMRCGREPCQPHLARIDHPRVQNTTAAKQKELSDAAAAALTSGKIVGSWSAVREASTRLTKMSSASSAGLNRVASLIAETASRGVLGATQQTQEQPRQIPVIEQQEGQPPLEQQQQQQQQPHHDEQQGPRQIPVIELAAPTQQQQQQQQGAHPQVPQGPLRSGAAAAPAGAGLEGLGTEAAETAAAAVGTGAAAAAAAEWGDYVTVLPSAGMDAPLAEAAMAQQAAAASQATPAWSVATAGGGNVATGSPEHLYPPGVACLLLGICMCGLEPDAALNKPLHAVWQELHDAAAVRLRGAAPALHRAHTLSASSARPKFATGRIIWLFPAEESFVEEAESALQAMDTAWQGAAGPLEGPGQPEQAQQGQQVQQAQQAQQQHGEVNMAEAEAAVESGRRHSAAETGAARRQTVVCEAARVPFERILIMPDCLNDHLPDAYLAALQQL